MSKRRRSSANLSDGAFPKTDDEALVTESARDMLGLHIGDEIIISTPDDTELMLTLSGFVENTANLMNNGAYGIFLTTEKFYAVYPSNTNGKPIDHSTIYYIQFISTGNLQNKIAEQKNQCGLSDDQISEDTKLLGLLGQSTNSFMIQVYAAAAVLFVLVLFAGIMMIASSLRNCRIIICNKFASASLIYRHYKNRNSIYYFATVP